MRTTALLPATMALFGKKKATPHEAATVWKNSTIQVMLNESGKMRFVIGSGKPEGYQAHFYAHHDQTGARLGSFEQIGTMTINQYGNITAVDGPSEEFLSVAAPILVYK